MLPLLEWHARARRGAAHDTWHGGRFLAEWADPDVLNSLTLTYTGLEIAACWQAFFELVQLFRFLLQKTAQTWQLSYPRATDESLHQYLLKLHADTL
jgi:hypothetical protein